MPYTTQNKGRGRGKGETALCPSGLQPVAEDCLLPPPACCRTHLLAVEEEGRGNKFLASPQL
eukprot:1160842-Pelagomonas_calceolata.AAC.1